MKAQAVKWKLNGEQLQKLFETKEKAREYASKLDRAEELYFEEVDLRKTEEFVKSLEESNMLYFTIGGIVAESHQYDFAKSCKACRLIEEFSYIIHHSEVIDEAGAAVVAMAAETLQDIISKSQKN